MPSKGRGLPTLKRFIDISVDGELSIVSHASFCVFHTGKDPIKSPRHFKDAEKKTGDLLRRIEAFSRDMNFADRPMVDKVKEEVQEAHDRLLQSIMTGKKK